MSEKDTRERKKEKRRKQLPDDLKEMQRYRKLKEEALKHSLEN
jgi:hypothetical protein